MSATDSDSDSNANSADSFGPAADRLSNRLMILESRLEALPTKINYEEAFSSSDGPDLDLRFARMGKTWRLLVGWHDGTRYSQGLLREADLATKARACVFLPRFFEHMRGEIARRAALVTAAHHALNEAQLELTLLFNNGAPLDENSPSSPVEVKPVATATSTKRRW